MSTVSFVSISQHPENSADAFPLVRRFCLASSHPSAFLSPQIDYIPWHNTEKEPIYSYDFLRQLTMSTCVHPDQFHLESNYSRKKWAVSPSERPFLSCFYWITPITLIERNPPPGEVSYLLCSLIKNLVRNFFEEPGTNPSRGFFRTGLHTVLDEEQLGEGVCFDQLPRPLFWVLVFGLLQPVPWKMRLWMLVGILIEILNGGEILVNYPKSRNSISTVSRGTNSNWDFDWIWIPLYLPIQIQIVILGLQIAHHSWFRLGFQPVFGVSSCAEREMRLRTVIGMQIEIKRNQETTVLWIFSNFHVKGDLEQYFHDSD